MSRLPVVPPRMAASLRGKGVLLTLSRPSGFGEADVRTLDVTGAGAQQFGAPLTDLLGRAATAKGIVDLARYKQFAS